MKKIVFLACILFFFLSCALAEPIALNLPDKDALVTPEGEILLDAARFDEIYAIGGGYFAAGEYETSADGFLRARYALVNSRGEALTEAKYASLRYESGVFIFEADGCYGAMNEALEALVPCEYTHLAYDGQAKGFLALRTDPWDSTADAVFSLDASGREQETGVVVMDLGAYFSGGLIPALSSATQSYGYLNAGGEWAVEPSFLFAGEFSEGLARAATAEGLGLIDAGGRWVLPPEYDTVDIGEAGVGGLIAATRYGEGVFLLLNGEKVAQFPGADVYAAILAGRAVIYAPDSVSLSGLSGEPLFSVGAGASLTPCERRVIVSTGEYGTQSVYLCDFSGNAAAGPFQALTSAGVHGGAEYFIVEAFEVEEVDGGGEDAYLRWDFESTLMGLVDENGKVVLPCEYSVLYPVAENRFFAVGAGAQGMLDASGNWLARFD